MLGLIRNLYHKLPNKHSYFQTYEDRQNMVCIHYHLHDFLVPYFLQIPRNIFYQFCLLQHNCTIHQQLPMLLIFKLAQEYLLLLNLISISLAQEQVCENIQCISNLLPFRPWDLFFVLALPFILFYLFYLLHHLLLIIIHHLIKAHHYYLFNCHLIYDLLILPPFLLIPLPIFFILLPILLIARPIQLIPRLILCALLHLFDTFLRFIWLFLSYTHHKDFLSPLNLHHFYPSNKLIPRESLLYYDALLQQFIQHSHYHLGQDLLYEQVLAH